MFLLPPRGAQGCWLNNCFGWPLLIFSSDNWHRRQIRKRHKKIYYLLNFWSVWCAWVSNNVDQRIVHWICCDPETRTSQYHGEALLVGCAVPERPGIPAAAQGCLWSYQLWLLSTKQRSGVYGFHCKDFDREDSNSFQTIGETRRCQNELNVNFVCFSEILTLSPLSGFMQSTCAMSMWELMV